MASGAAETTQSEDAYDENAFHKNVYSEYECSEAVLNDYAYQDFRDWLRQGQGHLTSAHISDYIDAHSLTTVAAWMAIFDVGGLDGAVDLIGHHFVDHFFAHTKQLPDPLLVLAGTFHYKEAFDGMKARSERGLQSVCLVFRLCSLADSQIPFTVKGAFFPRLSEVTLMISVARK